MRAIQLDYVSTRSPSILGVVVIVLALIMTAASWQYYSGLGQQLRAQDAKIQQLKERSGIQELERTKKKTSAEVQAKVNAAKQLADFLLMPWGDVFSALEAASLEDSALLSVEPDAKKHQLKITAEAKDKEVMFDYIRRLETTPELYGVYLLKHEIQEDIDQRPIRFVAVARWAGHP